MAYIPKPIEHVEPHPTESGQKLNRLRAAVLGANDGIVSTASLILGVAGASNSSTFILTAGVAGLVAGALSMGVGEYISVSSQRDAEMALISKETWELEHQPQAELWELEQLYTKKGLSEHTAKTVAKELTEHNALGAHLETELKIDPHNLVNPLQAAYASAAAFCGGAIVPILMIVLPPARFRIWVTFIGVLLALTATGIISSHFGGAHKGRATMRVVIGGFLAMAATYAIGKLFGVVGI